MSLVVLAKLVWSLTALTWPLVVLVVPVYPFVVLVWPLVVLVCSLVVLIWPFICPFVVLVCPLVVYDCPIVVPVVLCFDLFITNLFWSVIKRPTDSTTSTTGNDLDWCLGVFSFENIAQSSFRGKVFVCK